MMLPFSHTMSQLSYRSVTKSMATTKKRVRKAISGDIAQARILDAAEELFYRQGARNVGIEAVVARAGVNKMSLYRQFSSKDDLLIQYLQRRDQIFWAYFDASLAKHPEDPARQLRQLFLDLGKRVSQPGYRGCPFVNIAVEFPDPAHPARRLVADNKAGLLRRLTELATAARARAPAGLARALALVIEGVYAASQTYGADMPPGDALADVVDVLLEGHGL